MAPVSALEQMIKNASTEQAKTGMDAWLAWGEAHKMSIVEMGAPLGMSKRMMPAGVSDVQTEVAGYSLVQGDTWEEAMKMFEGHPHFNIEGATIQMHECLAVAPI